MAKIPLVVAAIGLALVFGACNSTSFKGAAPQKKPSPAQKAKNRPPADKYYKLSCENATATANLVTKLQGPGSMTVSLEGEFCGLPEKVATGAVTVLFAVDMSGSMSLSDPVQNGTCGRFKAAQALLEKLAKSAQAGVDVKVGLETFGNDASVVAAVTNLAQFQANLTPDLICRQDAGGTNYEAAFQIAQAELQAKEGQKVVYFISDGLPSVSNQTRGGVPGGAFTQPGANLSQVYEAGIRAAESLRQVGGLMLNAIYLDSAAARAQSQQFNGGQPVEEPSAYLEKIAGSKDRVRLVTSAAELADQITTFENPSDLALNTSSVKGEVTAGSLGSQDVKLRSITKDPSRPGIWLFVTEAFKLYSKNGTSIENRVTLSVNGADGKTYKATAVINFSSDD